MTAPHAAKELRQHALAALLKQNPEKKVAAAQSLWAEAATLLIATDRCTTQPAGVSKRSLFTPGGLAALLHSVTHIEFNAINIASESSYFRVVKAPHYVHQSRLSTHSQPSLQVVEGLPCNGSDLSISSATWGMFSAAMIFWVAKVGDAPLPGTVIFQVASK